MEPINIAHILKNAPSDIDLYSNAFGWLKIKYVTCDNIVCTSGQMVYNFDKFGRISEFGKCDLWPDETIRNWNDYKKVLFKPGQFITIDWGDTLEHAANSVVIFDCLDNDTVEVCECNGIIVKANISDFVWAPLESIETFYRRLRKNGFVLDYVTVHNGSAQLTKYFLKPVERDDVVLMDENHHIVLNTDNLTAAQVDTLRDINESIIKSWIINNKCIR